MKKIFIVFIIALFSGCATTTNRVPPRIEVVNFPEIGTIQTAEIGNTILKKGKVHEYDAIKLNNEVSAGDGIFMLKFTIPPQALPVYSNDKSYTYYKANEMTSHDAIAGTSPVFGGLKIRHKDNAMKLWGNNNNVTLTPKPEPIFEMISVTALNEPNFTQELIYNGRIDNQVKFLYRELYRGQMRDSFSQEVQYDLNESNIIGFKEARIEILNAKNTELEYKVLQNFPDTQ